MLDKFEHHMKAWAIIYVICTYLLWILVGLCWFKDFIRDFAGVGMVVIGLFYLALCELPCWVRYIKQRRT